MTIINHYCYLTIDINNVDDFSNITDIGYVNNVCNHNIIKLNGNFSNVSEISDISMNTITRSENLNRPIMR